VLMNLFTGVFYQACWWIYFEYNKWEGTTNKTYQGSYRTSGLWGESFDF
jgi:hypothetical protein